MFKSKRHMILSLKKKSGVQLSDSEIKELLGIENQEEKKPEDKPADKPAEAAPAATEEKPEDKPEDKTKEVNPSATPALSLEDLGKAVAQLSENMNMIMEALAAMMEGQAAPVAETAPTEEAKTEEVSDETEEEEMTEDDMEKELEKTIAELESLDQA